MLSLAQIFTFLFLMLGPFKIIGPFSKITSGASPVLIRQIAIRAILFSSIAIILAATIGQKILTNFGIPVQILAIVGGMILFIVALLNIIQQFSPLAPNDANLAPPSLAMAIHPLAFPTIVTPYGIAAVICFLSVCPDLNSRLIIGAMVLGIMVMNLIIMLITRYIYKYLAIVLILLGVILGVVQVALGFMFMYNQFRALLKL